MGQIPSISVSDEFADLIRDFAASKRISVGNAIRQLTANSPELIAFAEEKGVEINPGVHTWGGKRVPKDGQ